VRPQGERSTVLDKEYSSGDDLLDVEALRELLIAHRLMVGDADSEEGELLR
jgi:hypothetical protein